MKKSRLVAVSFEEEDGKDVHESWIHVLEAPRVPRVPEIGASNRFMNPSWTIVNTCKSQAHPRHTRQVSRSLGESYGGRLTQRCQNRGHQTIAKVRDVVVEVIVSEESVVKDTHGIGPVVLRGAHHERNGSFSPLLKDDGRVLRKEFGMCRHVEGLDDGGHDVKTKSTLFTLSNLKMNHES